MMDIKNVLLQVKIIALKDFEEYVSNVCHLCRPLDISAQDGLLVFLNLYQNLSRSLNSCFMEPGNPNLV